MRMGGLDATIVETQGEQETSIGPHNSDPDTADRAQEDDKSDKRTDGWPMEDHDKFAGAVKTQRRGGT